MSNVLQILRRDFKRLVTVPAAWVIMIGLILLPPLYAWFNIYGFWDPYGNTNSIRIAVANSDTGTSNDLLGDVNLGDQIEDTLKNNDQLGWQFVSEDDAMEAVKSGDCYAAIIIPSDFSADLAGVLDNNGTRPTLEYYVNEKSNPVAPKITDLGATTVDRTVNNAFVSTVSEVLSNALNSVNENITDASGKISDETTGKLDEAEQKVSDMRSTISGLNEQLASIPQKTQSARNAINEVKLAAAAAGSGLSSTSQAITDAQNTLNTFSANANSAIETGSGLASQAASQSTASINKVSSAVSQASGTASQAVSEMQSVTDSNAKLIEQLKSVSDDAAYQQMIKKLEETNNTAANMLSDLKTLSDDTTATSESVSKLSTDFNTGTQDLLKNVDTVRNTINTGAIPQLNSGLSSLAATTGTLSGTVTNQDMIVSQTTSILDQLDQVASDIRTALSSTDAQLAKVETKLTTISTDLKALGTADLLQSVTGISDLDTEKIASFMQSPTVLETENVYPLNSYGSGMAPLLTNLALWVGAFAFVVIFKVEVDDEGLEDLELTAREKYFARYLLLSVMGAIQGVLCTVGDLMLGVQTENAFLFCLTGVITSLVYLSITYALSTTFMHVGKGLCIALVIVQIPGASGLYPIEMMTSFFRLVYPLVPFSYSIDAFRETIAGFYDGDWLKSIGALLLFAAAAFFIGLVIRPLLTNLNKLFSRQIEESDMIIGEEVQLKEREYSVSQAIQVLADQDGYREIIEEKASRFAELYPKLKRGALIAGFVVPIILVLVFSMTAGEKVVVLATWMLWILLIIGFLVIIEYIRYSLERQVELGSLSDDAIESLIMEHQAKHMRRKKRARLAKKKKLPHKAHPHHKRRADADGTESHGSALNVTGTQWGENGGIAMFARNMGTGESLTNGETIKTTKETAEGTATETNADNVKTGEIPVVLNRRWKRNRRNQQHQWNRRNQQHQWNRRNQQDQWNR